MESLQQGRVSQEGTQDFNTRTWQQIYYYQDLTAAGSDSGYLRYREEDGMVFNSEGGVTREANGLSKIVGGNRSEPNLSGDVVYAYLIQAEDCLITVSPSLTAWGERKEGTEDVIQYSWLSSAVKSE
ncbi:hypothetical protein GCM10009037_29330 [Halarchaeum grantii]|uniref:Uncharacterized protein n=1 Tax=Halarchaeum grantii TaxID=1193105 RepID=A0A830FDD0_9EURY|nr:hypothetical protein GCM10009037_29330 [Halarchaeum grantii]